MHLRIWLLRLQRVVNCLIGVRRDRGTDGGMYPRYLHPTLDNG